MFGWFAGDRPLDEYNSYVSTDKAMGIDSSIAQEQAALNRYLEA